MSKSLFIGIDFDGTVVKHAYPEIGEPLEGALECLRSLNKAGHKLILYTMRSEERLAQAVEYLEENGVELWAVNDNPSQKHWTKSPKIFCNLYIDDASLGIPLMIDQNEKGDYKGRPYVCWESVEFLLKDRGVIW